MLEKRRNQNTLMYELILDDPICERVKGVSLDLTSSEYANRCDKLKSRLGLA